MPDIPTRIECLAVMDQTSMPAHIQKHSLLVARIALYLGSLLNGNGVGLNLALLEAGALLHDIAKARSLSTGENHSDLGALMLDRLGFHALSPIVQDHASLDLGRLRGPVTESLIVNYADKRVRHDRVVTIEDRFSDLIVRYARSADHVAYFHERLHLYKELEWRIFEGLSITPDHPDLMRLSHGEEHTFETGAL